jgi:hypothetical protein
MLGLEGVTAAVLSGTVLDISGKIPGVYGTGFLSVCNNDRKAIFFSACK